MGSSSASQSDVGLKVVAVLGDPTHLVEVSELVGPAYEVVNCTPKEALGEVADLQTAAVIADASIGGVQLLAELHQRCPQKRRVLIARGEDPPGLADALDRAEVDYVVRPPLARQHIIKAIEILLESFDRERASQSLLTTLRNTARDEANGKSFDIVDRALRRLRIPNYRDGTTGLYNAESFYERVREEVARARRYKKPLSLIYIDLDEFAAVNKEHGRERGDEALAEIAAILRGRGDTAARESDIVGRVGGEEFGLLLPETDRTGGQIKAERIRAAISAWSQASSIHITVSAGVATFENDSCGPAELMQRALGAQRLARESGGDQISMSSIADSPRLGHERVQFTSYHRHLDELTTTLEDDRAISMLYCDLSELRRIEREFGVIAHAALFARAGELLADSRGSCLRREDRLFRTEDASGYLCFLAPPRSPDGLPAPLDLETIAKRVQNHLSNDLSADIARHTSEPIRIVVGYARVLFNSMARPERLILKSIADARESARLISQRRELKDKAVLQELILREQLRAVYQPIVQLESGDIFGFEALTRGPAETSLESPAALFGIADQVDLTFELDRACFRGALHSAVGLSPVHRLFVNLLPQSFYDTRFIEREVERLLKVAELNPANVVFEITEKLAIENFSAFRDALAMYTSMGFGVAIDDVGTRHSNLETVMALQPHFIKVSDVLTRGVSRSTVKREMMRSLQRIAETIDAVIVAEGIEDSADLEVLVELGIRYGQGFYLARPAPAFPEILLERQREIRTIASDPRNQRTAQLEVVRLRDDEQTDQHLIPTDRPPAARGSAEIVAARTDAHRTEDTKPHVVLPGQQPWKSLAEENLGGEGESSLLETLRDGDDNRKRTVS